MRPSKSRSRSKSNRNRPSGNIINRVFDSSGPDGKVRGTPQQIIDKYSQLARDAQLSNDRVAAENFQQHAEHYLRTLAEAQREQEMRRAEADAANRERQALQNQARQQQSAENGSDTVEGLSKESTSDSAVIDTSPAGDTGLVETAENAPKKPSRSRRKSKPVQENDTVTSPEPTDAEASKDDPQAAAQ